MTQHPIANPKAGHALTDLHHFAGDIAAQNAVEREDVAAADIEAPTEGGWLLQDFDEVVDEVFQRDRAKQWPIADHLDCDRPASLGQNGVKAMAANTHDMAWPDHRRIQAAVEESSKPIFHQKSTPLPKGKTRPNPNIGKARYSDPHLTAKTRWMTPPSPVRDLVTQIRLLSQA